MWSNSSCIKRSTAKRPSFLFAAAKVRGKSIDESQILFEGGMAPIMGKSVYMGTYADAGDESDDRSIFE